MKLEFKLFLRNKATWIGLLVLLLNGLAGLYFGKTFVAHQKRVIEKAAVLQKRNMDKDIHHFGNELGLLLYHHKFSFANGPNNWTAFANGQRDINPYLSNVTMLALEGQLYDTELSNPVTSLLGNMDLCFVFIYLFPIIIVAFSYNLLSVQKESGVWPLLRAQTNGLFKLIWRKLLVRMVLVYALAVLLMAIACVYLALPLDLHFLSILLLIAAYLFFWFALAFFIISFGKSSSFNASALIGLWVLFCIFLPASLNLALSKSYPVNEAMQNVINQREGYHEKWDKPKELTMERFYSHYPQFRQYPFPADKNFSWYWYYAMQQQGDDQALPSRKAVDEKLKKRQQFTAFSALFMPVVQAQLSLNEATGSDLGQHLAFQNTVRTQHEQLRLHFYPYIFQEQPVSAIDFGRFKLFKQISPVTAVRFSQFLPILLFTIILLALASIRLTRAFH